MFATREQMDTWCGRGILYLVLSILVFGPLATGAVRSLEFLVLQGLTVGVVMLWLARLWLNRRSDFFWPRASWGLVVFFIYVVVRYQQADIEYVARRELIRILVYEVLFLAIVNNLRRTEHARAITWVLMCLAAVLSVFAVYQFSTHYDRVWQFVKPAGYLKRGSGTYINPNHLAGFLEMVLPVGLACALLGREDHTKRIVLGYGSLVLLVGIAVTGSRGGWIASGVMLFFFWGVLLFHGGQRWGAVAMLLFLTVGVAIFFAELGTPSLRLEDAFSHGQWIDARRYIWRVAWREWQDHFWFGVGPGHFDYCFPEYRSSEVPLQMQPLYVHNDYLNTLTDWGLSGALIIGGTIWLLYAGAIRIWRSLCGSSPEGFSNRLSVIHGAGCGLFAMLVHSFTDFNMQVPANAIVAAVLMALLSVPTRSDDTRCRVSLRLTGRILASVMALMAIFYLGLQDWRKAREYLCLDRADEAKRKNDLDAARTALEGAFKAEPKNFNTAYDIGEILRAQSFAGNNDYRALAERAMTWFRRAMALNPHDAFSAARMGMCLDWIGETAEGSAYFERAQRLDPNGYYLCLLQGWHRIQLDDYDGAKSWLERSLSLRAAYENPKAAAYLDIVNRKIAEARSNNQELSKP